MNKLQDLRNHLLNRIPSLRRGPDRLLTFIEDGSIIFHQGENLSHRLKMTAKIIVTDWEGSSDDIIIPILEWMRVREPGRDPENSIRFEAEILNSGRVDLLVELDLLERVIVKHKEDGGYDITHVLPPSPLEMNADASLQITATGPDGSHSWP